MILLHGRKPRASVFCQWNEPPVPREGEMARQDSGGPHAWNYELWQVEVEVEVGEAQDGKSQTLNWPSPFAFRLSPLALSSFQLWLRPASLWHVSHHPRHPMRNRDHDGKARGAAATRLTYCASRKSFSRFGFRLSFHRFAMSKGNGSVTQENGEVKKYAIADSRGSRQIQSACLTDVESL